MRGYRFLGIVLVVALGGVLPFPLKAGEQKGLSAQPTRPSPSPPLFHPSPFALEPRLGVIFPAFSARMSPLLQVEGLYRILLGREQKGEIVLSAGGGIMGYGLREKKTIASDQVPPSPIELSSWMFGVYGVGEVSSSAVPPWFLPFFQLGVGTGWIFGSVQGFDTTAPFREETPLLRFELGNRFSLGRGQLHLSGGYLLLPTRGEALGKGGNAGGVLLSAGYQFLF